MAHAALLSGMALANSGLGLAHGVAAALGIHNRVPHGLACAVMLPAALRLNCQVRQAELAHLACQVLDLPPATAAAEAAQGFIAHVEGLCRRVGVPSRLGQLGVGRQQIPELVRSSRGTSMSANPRDVSDEELSRLLEEML